MFDRLAWRRECYERYLFLLDDEEDEEDELDAREEAAYWADAEDPSRIDDYDTPFGDLALRADDIEAGRLELPPRWKLDRPSPGVLVWTTPSGRRYACGPTGEPLPLPDGEAPFHSWAS
jgi:hypothetical protein